MENKKWIWFAIVFTILMGTSTCLFSETETPAPPASEQTEFNLISLIKASGFLGWLIIFLSIISVALEIEFFVKLQRNKLIPPELLQEIEELFEEESYEEVMETCTAEPGFFTNVLSAALPKAEEGFEPMMNAAKAAIEEESIKLHQRISWLQLLGSLAPMLGLLGTVQGMIIAFHKIASMEGAPKPKHLADGIYVALLTTFEGLIVAIPCLFCYFFLKNKLVRINMEVGLIVEELLEHFRKS
ncbi:MAG: MotA/TolQ/ExbB proton channel family protein [Candidatus Brocadiae bacterium]|nr:MotA/TolQ/ExbB proton channel family protein [Candidatus Brocadiia bacterium]